jgi:hypothetical protein
LLSILLLSIPESYAKIKRKIGPYYAISFAYSKFISLNSIEKYLKSERKTLPQGIKLFNPFSLVKRKVYFCTHIER